MSTPSPESCGRQAFAQLGKKPALKVRVLFQALEHSAPLSDVEGLWLVFRTLQDLAPLALATTTPMLLSVTLHPRRSQPFPIFSSRLLLPLLSLT